MKRWALVVNEGGASEEEHLQANGVVQARDFGEHVTAHNQAFQLQAMVDHQGLKIIRFDYGLLESLRPRQR